MNISALKIKIVLFFKFFLGKKMVSHLLTNKYLKTYRKTGIIFIHIPKAAGTSIANAIYGKRNGHLTAAAVKDGLRGEYEKLFSFSVSRDPYGRLTSAYRFATQGQTTDGAIANPNLYSGEEFKDFETFVTKWLVNQNLDELDNVFKPQHLFVFKEKTCLVNKLYKLEDLNPLEQELSIRTGKDVKIHKKNISNKHFKSIIYTTELKEIVYNLYKKDFELFGYNK
jgi:hypothetical protein